jgi:hypothetical protein
MTWLRRIGTGIAATAALVALCTPAASAHTAPAQLSTAAQSSATARSADGLPGLTTDCSATYFRSDPRLGPDHLPLFGVVGLETLGYVRTGGEPATTFLGTYYDPSANGGSGGWLYPPDNGYVLRQDGSPIEYHRTLSTGQDIDRFGSEYGAFLAPEGLPYAARSIPPQSLVSTPAAGCNYHDYRVLRPFTVDAGPIAAWFAQPGGGLQYQLDGSLVPGAPAALNVMWLVANGYLSRLN